MWIEKGINCKCSKISNIFFRISNKMLVFRAGINKMINKIASREDPDQTAADMGLHCLSRAFWL